MRSALGGVVTFALLMGSGILFAGSALADERDYLDNLASIGVSGTPKKFVELGNLACRAKAAGYSKSEQADLVEEASRGVLEPGGGMSLSDFSNKIALSARLYLCGQIQGTSSPSSTSPTSTTRMPSSTAAQRTPGSPNSASPPAFSTSDVSMPPTASSRGSLVDVRVAGHEGYDRMVLEFADGVPWSEISYEPLPGYEDGTGADIPLVGANAALRIVLRGATAAGWGGSPRTYFGPSTVAGETAVLTEAKAAGDFEAVVSWVVGLRSEVPFRATTLTGPPRLVIDFQTPP
jgi:hypothetical protein